MIYSIHMYSVLLSNSQQKLQLEGLNLREDIKFDLGWLSGKST